MYQAGQYMLVICFCLYHQGHIVLQAFQCKSLLFR
nr:MAG TPA: hypothetical protein [Caudoviricetes sp.]